MNSTNAGFLADQILSGGGLPRSGKPPAHEWSNSQLIPKKTFQSIDADAVIPGIGKRHSRLEYKKNIVQSGSVLEVKGASLKAGAWDEIAGYLAGKFAHKYSKVIEERALSTPAFNTVAELVWLAPTPARRERVGAWVSGETSEYIAEELTDSQSSGDDYRALAAKKIEYSMSTLINSIAEGIRDKGQSIKFDLAANGRFSDGVARAILFRLPVSFYKESGFIASLYRDFEMAVSAGKVSHEWWDVSISSAGVIMVTIKNETPVTVLGEKPWKKAQAIRFSSLKRE